MAQITIAGKQVTVDDVFLDMTPEEQGAVVDEIYSDMQAKGFLDAPEEGRPIMQDGQQIGAQVSNLEQPLSIMVDGSPEAPLVPAATEPSMMERVGQSVGSTMTGIGQGATMGAYDEIAALVGSPIKGAENLITGQDSINGLGDVLPFLGRSFTDAHQGQQALVNQAYEQAPIAATAGDIGGALGAGLLSGGSNLISVAKPTIMGMAGRGAVEGGIMGGVSGFNSAEDPTLPGRLSAAAQGAAVGGGLGAITGGVAGGLMARNQQAAVPTTQELADQAGALYQSARASGVTASPQMTDGIANTIESIARAENVVLPSGKVNSTYPKLVGVLNVFDEYRGSALDVGQMQAIRRNLQDAAKSLDPGERRVATIMLGEFDDFAHGVAPELAEASNLYWRSKMGEMIEEAIDLATNRSSQYSQSGMDNALRTQFRQLNAQIIKGRVPGVTPELAAQIARVADGGPIENFARAVGKFSVRGPVSAIPSILAGTAGVGVGGPVGGALAAGAVALPGEIGRRVAERGTVNNAQIAALLARAGGALPSQDYSPVAQALVNAGGNVGGRLLPNF